MRRWRMTDSRMPWIIVQNSGLSAVMPGRSAFQLSRSARFLLDCMLPKSGSCT